MARCTSCAEELTYLMKTTDTLESRKLYIGESGNLIFDEVPKINQQVVYYECPECHAIIPFIHDDVKAMNFLKLNREEKSNAD